MLMATLPFSTRGHQCLMIVFPKKVELTNLKEAWNHEEPEDDLDQEGDDEEDVEEVDVWTNHQHLDEDHHGEKVPRVCSNAETVQSKFHHLVL